jgi:hypothetical protein
MGFVIPHPTLDLGRKPRDTWKPIQDNVSTAGVL